ncbi:unnamed protein product, partial [Adineta ricciae]
MNKTYRKYNGTVTTVTLSMDPNQTVIDSSSLDDICQNFH